MVGEEIDKINDFKSKISYLKNDFYKANWIETTYYGFGDGYSFKTKLTKGKFFALCLDIKNEYLESIIDDMREILKFLYLNYNFRFHEELEYYFDTGSLHPNTIEHINKLIIKNEDNNCW